MNGSEPLSLAAFCREINIRAESSPPLKRSPDMLVVAVARVTANPGTMGSRILGKLLVALSQDGGIEFGRNDIYALDAETRGIAAEVIEGRHNGWWSYEEWDEVRRMVEAVELQLQQQQQ